MSNYFSYLAGHIQSWINLIKTDHKAVVQAASNVTEAAEYLNTAESALQAIFLT